MPLTIMFLQQNAFLFIVSHRENRNQQAIKSHCRESAIVLKPQSYDRFALLLIDRLMRLYSLVVGFVYPTYL